MPVLIDPLKGRPAPPRGERMTPTGDVFFNPKNGKVETDDAGRKRVVGATYPEVRKGR